MLNKVSDALICAVEASLNSPDIETKVGAALLCRDRQVVSTNRNGFIDGHCGSGLPKTRPEKYSYMLHAERRLLFACARQGISTEGHSIVCTLSPCPDCLRAIWQAGITEVFFRDRYRNIEQSFEMNDLAVEEEELKHGLYRWTLSIRRANGKSNT